MLRCHTPFCRLSGQAKYLWAILISTPRHQSRTGAYQSFSGAEMAYLVIWIICAVIGALIGESKGRKVEGALLGGLLGLLGVLIIALLPSKPAVGQFQQ